MDANIFLNYWFDEFSKSAEAYYAQQLFERTIGCEFLFVITDITLDELSAKSNLSMDKIKDAWLSEFIKMKKIIIEIPTIQDLKNAARMTRELRIPKKDAIHAAFCLRNKLPIVTRDKHFQEIDGLSVFLPEEL